MVDALFQMIYDRVSKRRGRLGLYLVVFPMLAIIAYYLLVATRLYASDSLVVVKRSGDFGGQLAGITLPIVGALGNNSHEDALHLVEFIRSPDMLQRLDKNFDLRAEYEVNGLDFVNRLMPWSSREDFVDLYRKRVELSFDEKTGVLTIRALSSSPERALALNKAILAESEPFINNLSQQIAREQLQFAEQEAEYAQKSLSEARAALVAYQNKTGLLDPAADASISTNIIGQMEAQLAAKEVELQSSSTVLQPDSAQIVAIRQAISSLKRQLDAERRKLTSAKGRGLNKVAADYVEYKAKVDFSADLYRVSLAALEKVRVDAGRKVKNLAVLSSPQLPEDYKYPRRLYMLGAWLLGLLVIHGLVRLSIAIIEDHRD